MHYRDRIVALHHVPQRAQPLLYSYNLHLIRYAVAQMLQLLIRSRCRHKQTPPVAGRQASDDAGSSDRAVADGNDVLQLGLEDGVEVLGRAEGDEGVAVCESCEDADSVERRVLDGKALLLENAGGGGGGGGALTHWNSRMRHGQP